MLSFPFPFCLLPFDVPMHPVVLPILDANMTHGVIRAWFKREGEEVRCGEALFEVETDKVNAEVVAEASGVVRRIVAPVGTRVPVLGVLAFVGAADEAVPDNVGAIRESPHEPVPTSGASSGSSRTAPTPEAAEPKKIDSLSEGDIGGSREGAQRRVAASPAARRLARECGVALEKLRGTGPRGEITHADVEAARPPVANGQLDPAFLDLLRRDPAAFRALSSELKVHLYRQHGARIGAGVRIEPGALIIAAQISIGAASTIGADSSIECDTLRLGRLVAFGKRTRVRCRSVEIGDALWSKDDVVIGGGGGDEAGARLQAGAACFFGEGAYLNTCQPLTLGDEVCIGSRAMLFTHSHWQSVLRGYPSLFAPIAVGDHVFIGNQAFVFPGVTIAAGATVMVNSFVALNVPANTLVGGVPAQVVRHIAAPSRDEQIAIVRDRLVAELAALLSAHGRQVTPQVNGPATTLNLRDGAVVQFTPAWDSAASYPQERVVVLTFVDATTTTVAPQVTLFDLAASRVLGMQDDLSDEVREFCRRRGIRFRPFAWRYRVGHFEGERFIGRA
jgi:acetyltransferase-like isoleucine patch superfamily enzyme